jgi:ribulose-phosphate 3-epimerase
MISDPFTRTGPQIVPSILSADFAKLADEIADVDRGGADFLHLDIMDGHFVPNISFGPAVTAATRRSTAAFLDVHLMITEPLKYAEAFVKAGANSLTFHVEVAPDPVAVAKQIKQLGCRVGVTLNPATPVESIWPVLDEVDLVLVMSVVPGFSGQSFMPEVLAKCEAIRGRLRPNQRLQIDGGIKPDNIHHARNAGVDWFVVASAIFDQPDRRKVIAELRKGLQ